VFKLCGNLPVPLYLVATGLQIILFLFCLIVLARQPFGNFFLIFFFGACQWGCTTGNAATVAHSTKKQTSGKDSVIEGKPLLLFM
jgi:hypothetical protein